MTPLELKGVVGALKAEVDALKARLAELEKKTACLDHPFFKPTQAKEEPKTSRKMCPHCNEVPAHFFHVRNCAKNKKNKADDRNGNSRTP